MAEDKIIYKKISQLDETPEVYGPESVPVNQNGKTFRVTFDTVVNWLLRLIGVVTAVNTIDDLQSMPVRFKKSVQVLQDGVGGFFKHVSTGTPDGINVFPAADGGAWVRFIGNLYSKEQIDSKLQEFGSKVTSEYYPISAGATSLPSPPLNSNGDPMQRAWTWLVQGVTYTQSAGGNLVAAQGRQSRADWNNSKWSLVDMGALPVAPVASEIIEGGSLAVSQDAVYQENNKRGVSDRNKGFDVIDIVKTDFTFDNKVIKVSNGAESALSGFAATDFIELPDGWSDITFTHLGSLADGFSLYNKDKAPQTAITLVNGNNVITRNSTYRNAKYARMSFPKASMNSVGFKIRTKTDPSFYLPSIKKTYSKVSFIQAKQSLGKEVVDYDGSILTENNKGIDSSGTLVTVSGVKATKKIKLGDWEEIRFTPIESSTYGFALYGSNSNLLAFIVGDINIDRVPKIILKSDYPDAQYLATSFNSSLLDKFELTISKNNTYQIKSEADKVAKWAVEGLTPTYLNFNDDTFSRVGLLLATTGQVDPSYTAYKSTNQIRLSDNWKRIVYDAFVATTTGVCLYDSNGVFITCVKSVNGAPIEINRSEYINAYHFSVSWNGAFGNIYFRILSEVAAKSDPFQNKDVFRELTRVSNLDLKSNLDFGVVPEKVFLKTDVPGKPFARIPSIILTNSGTTIVASEFRSIESSGDDKGQFDLIIKRRTSSGSTWDQFNLFPYTTLRGRAMNPSFIVDRSGSHGVSGRIYCFVATILPDDKFAANCTTAELDTIYRYSDDDGVTWSDIFSIKNLWNTSQYTASLVSPTNGIQLQNGTFVIPCMVVKDATWRSGLIYKLPSGDWTFSTYTPRVLDNESLVVELDNNQVILNCRYELGQKFRSVYEFDFKTNGFKLHNTDRTFDAYHACQMSIEKCVIGGQKVYLMSYPDKSDVQNANANNSRFNTTIFASTDLKRWIRVYVVNFPRSYGYAVITHYGGKTKVIYEVSDESLESSVQDITIAHSHIDYCVRVEMYRTTEEKLNEMIYQYKGWNY